jgi:16S rRNA (guanine527-N7)-methyltransferase
MSPGPEAPPLDAEGFRELLESKAPAFGLNVSTSTVSRLALYLAELDAWRRTTNLTGPLSSRVLAQHALESILPVDLIVHGARVVDIGSGAGFPGLPIAIARPDLQVTLLEPRKKRTAFLRHAVRALELPAVQVAETRIEKVGGQTFQVAVTRAVGHFDEWLGDASFLEPGGLLLAWTTVAVRPDRALAERFRSEPALPIPGTEQGEIAAFRKL